MSGMNVTNFKSGAFPRQTAWSQSRQTTFMGNFGKRIGLIHKLGKLTGAEKFVHHRRHRFGIDEIVRHHGFDILQAHFFFNGPFHANQTDTILIFNELANGTNTAVSQMVNIIYAAFTHAVLQIDQIFDGCQNIFVSEDGQIRWHIQVQLIVHLRPADIRQIVSFRFKKETAEKLRGGFRSRRIAGTKPSVDLHDRVFRGFNMIHEQRIANGSIVQIFINVDEFQLFDSLFLGNFKSV